MTALPAAEEAADADRADGEPAGAPELAIHTSGLTKLFAGGGGVEGLDLDVRRGSIFGFIGPSGSGKTTVVRLLTGLYGPTEGDAEVLGRRPWAFTPADRRRLGYLPQQSVLYPELSLQGNLRFAAGLYGIHGDRKRLREVLEFVELAEHSRRRLRDASGGMQRRLALAAALVHGPELLFLDEPTAGLDPILRTKLWQHFQTLRANGTTLFVTTQYEGEASYCDQVGLMVEGRLLVVDSPVGLRRRAMGGDVVRMRTGRPLDPETRARLLEEPFVSAVRVSPDDPGLVDVVVQEGGTAVAPLLSFFTARENTVVSIEQHLVPFDEVFVALVRTHRPSSEPAGV